LGIIDAVVIAIGGRAAAALRIGVRADRGIRTQVLEIDNTVVIAIFGRAAAAPWIGVRARRFIWTGIVAIQNSVVIAVARCGRQSHDLRLADRRVGQTEEETAVGGAGQILKAEAAAEADLDLFGDVVVRAE